MPESSTVRDWFREHWSVLGVFGFLTVIYLVNRSPHPGFHDSLSWLFGAVDGFDFNTNATSHFLYRNVLYILASALPFISPITLLTLFTVLFSLLCLWRIYQIVQIWFPGQFPGLFVVLLLGLSFTWWQQSEIIEVYTFNSFFFLSFLLYAFRDIQAGERNRVVWVGVWLAIGLLTHIQHILSIPFFLWYVLFAPVKPGKRILALSLPVLSFLLLLVPVWILHLHSVSAIFFDNHFRSNVMEVQFMDLVKSGVSSIGFFCYNFHVFAVFILIGIYQLFKTERKSFWAWLIILGPYLAFALKYNVSDAHIFFLPTYLLLGIASSWGWHAIWEEKKRPRWIAMTALLVFPILLYSTAFFVGNRVPQLEDLKAKKAYKGGIAYFIFPGKRQAKDPLALAQEMRETGTLPAHASEWNVPNAVAYLKWKENK